MSLVLHLNSERGSGLSQDFTTFLNGDLPCDRNDGWMIALHSSTIYYSWNNIAEEFGNNIVRYSKDLGVTFEPDIVIPDGVYDLSAINSFVQAEMFARGDYDGVPDSPIYQLAILPNFNTLRTVVVLKGDYQLDMSAGNLYQLLGLDPVLYTVTSQGTNKVDVNRGVDRVAIQVDIVDGSYDGGVPGSTVYSFTPVTPPGSSLVEKPVNLIYLPCNRTSFNKIRVRITDQNNNILNLKGENVNLTLHLKKF